MNKILLICHGFPFETLGGVGQVMLRLIEALPKLGWTVHVLVPKNTRGYQAPRIEKIEQDWGSLHILHRSFLRWSSAWQDRRANVEVAQLLQTEEIQYIHVHHLNGLPLGWIPRLCEIYLHITLHDYAIPCARGQMLNRHQAICHGPSQINCANCIDSWLVLESSNNIVYNRMILTQRILKRADRIDAPSQDLQKRMSTLYPSVQIELCKLPTKPTNPFAPQDLHSNHQLIFVGSIHPSKGLHILLQVMHRLQNKPFHLKIIGGATQSELQPNYAQTWLELAENLPNVSYLGEQSHEDLLNEVASSHCLILPSIWPENSPLVIREALQYGLHVICGEGGSKELSDSIIQVSPLSVYNLLQSILQLPTVRLECQTYPDPQLVIQDWIHTPRDHWG